MIPSMGISLYDLVLPNRSRTAIQGHAKQSYSRSESSCRPGRMRCYGPSRNNTSARGVILCGIWRITPLADSISAESVEAQNCNKAPEDGMTTFNNFNISTPARLRRLLRTTRAYCAAAMLAWIIAGVSVYAPGSEAAAKPADVLLVLAPPADRMGYAEQLMAQGYAHTLVVSVPLGKNDPVSAVCREKRAYPILCFAPSPVTTQGEARALRSLAAKYGWTSATVITGPSHVPRAQVLLQRCFKGTLDVVANHHPLPLISLMDPRQSWAFQYTYETAAFVKVAVNQDC